MLMQLKPLEKPLECCLINVSGFFCILSKFLHKACDNEDSPLDKIDILLIFLESMFSNHTIVYQRNKLPIKETCLKGLAAQMTTIN